MKKIITTQSQLDKVKLNFDGELVITGGTIFNPINLVNHYPNANVILSGNAVVSMFGKSQVNVMWGSSQVKEMWGSSQVKEMRGSSQVNVMWESSQVKEMRESSQIKVMRGSSQVKEMLESSQVKEMRESSQIKVMRGSSQVNVMRESSQVKEMRGSSQVKEMRGSSQVNVMWGSSQVKEMWGSSQVKEMRGSSQVNVMWESSQVKEMRESSQIKVMRGSSQVKEMLESSQVKEMLESSQVNVMWGSSQVNVMWGSSQVKEMWGSGLIGRVLGHNNKISCFGFNYVFMPADTDISGITLNDTSQILFFDSFQTQPDIEFYLKNYPIKNKDENTLIMYKAVHKTSSGEYVSNYNRNFKYTIGEVKNHSVSDNLDESCSTGLHVGHLMFATDFGRSWGDSLAILELEVPKDKIVVSRDCDGKVRTSDLTVIRELDIEEYKHLL